MEGCRMEPRPSTDIKVICAGQSSAGMAFTAKYADYNFCLGKGFNAPREVAPTVARMQEVAAREGRAVPCYALVMVIAAETDAAAMAKWELYRDGADDEALTWLATQGAADTKSGGDTPGGWWSSESVRTIYPLRRSEALPEMAIDDRPKAARSDGDGRR